MVSNTIDLNPAALSGGLAVHLLRADDWATMLRLAGEAGELADGSAERRAHLLTGISTLVGAKGGNIFELNPDVPGGLPALSRNQFTDGLFPAVNACDDYLQGGLHLTDPVPLPFFESGLIVTQATDMVSERVWRRSDQYQVVREPVGLSNQSYGTMWVGGRLFGMGFHQEKNEKPFSPRSLQIMAAMTRVCPGAWGVLRAVMPGQQLTAKQAAQARRRAACAADPRVGELPPRLRVVLDGLLTGDGAKQIAAKTKLSTHTVYEYTKQLYRRLGVGSRAELFARLSGDSR